jgi:carboxyl-terminal processing protease
MKKMIFYGSIIMALFISANAMSAENSGLPAPVGQNSAVAPIPDAAATFQEVMKLIEENYVDPKINQDILWSGATTGLLQTLIQLKNLPVNTLLSPTELEEMNSGIKGQFSGLGMVIDQIGQTFFVKDVLPESAAAKADIQAGDRILAVDGQAAAGRPLAELVNLIRGPAGSKVELLLQRDRTESTLRLTRGVVSMKQVQGRILPGNIGYLRLAFFSESTLTELDAFMNSALKQGMTRLILDLRNCPGGLLDGAVSVTGRFLNPGEKIVTVKYRDGREQSYVADKEPHYQLPIIVLINTETSSGAEIMAAALAENRHVRLVGEKTLGKGTVEKIMKLHNGWGIKLSVAYFYSPQGHNWQGQGISPDFILPGPINFEKSYSPDRKIDPESDPQLKAALSLLALDK